MPFLQARRDRSVAPALTTRPPVPVHAQTTSPACETTSRLWNVGSDLGGAIKGFKQSMREGEEEINDKKSLDDKDEGRVIDGEVTSHKKDKV